MKNVLFIGYQLRCVVVPLSCATLATDINPLYVPHNAKARQRFDVLLSSLRLPFTFQTSEQLFAARQIISEDAPIAGSDVLTFGCSLCGVHSSEATVEFFDDNGNLIKIPYTGMASPESQIPGAFLGYDVVDASMGGGFDSAIHTYRLDMDQALLNEYRLISDMRAAHHLQMQANREACPHHFTVWRVDLVATNSCHHS